MAAPESRALVLDEDPRADGAVAHQLVDPGKCRYHASAALGLTFAGLCVLALLGSLPANAPLAKPEVGSDVARPQSGDGGGGQVFVERFELTNGSINLAPQRPTAIRVLDDGACKTNRHWQNYCSADTTTKVFAASPDCSRVWWASDVLDLEHEALGSCGSSCSIYDRNGRRCFQCGGTAHRDAWGEYCRARTPKYWVTDEACGVFGWASVSTPLTRAREYCREHAAPGSKCYAYDHNGELCPSVGEHDYREKLSACLQYREEWCWATTVVILANYYKPNGNPIKNDNCRGMTCKVVGSKVAPHRPSTCCQDKDSCRHVDGRPHDITRGFKYLTGMRFRVWFASLAEHELAAALRRGPLVMGVGWSSGGGHIMVIGGTDDNGGFFLHDPINAKGEGSFQRLTYQQLVTYHPPYGSNVGHWRETYALHELGNCGTAGPFESQWKKYCAASSPKAWAYKNDCTTFNWRWGGPSPVATALRECGDDCFTYDRDGKLCGLEGTSIIG